MKSEKTGEGNSFLDSLIPALLVVTGILILALAGRLGIEPQSQEKEIAERLISGESLLNGNTVNVERLERMSRMDYSALKSELGVRSDFSVYIVDEENNIIPIDGKTCIGSPRAKVAGRQCG